MPKKIYAVDAKFGSNLSGAGFLSGPAALVGAYERSLLGGTVVSVTSVVDMVTKVMAAAGSEKIYNLLILGHGGAAYQAVGAGTLGDTTGDYSLQVDSFGGSLAGSAKAWLPKLAPLFTSDAIVLLGGCNVANTYENPTYKTKISGEDYLKIVSKALGGVYVEASDFYQIGLYPTTFGKTVRCNSTSCFVASNVVSLDRF
jgi:hypothetical protein